MGANVFLAPTPILQFFNNAGQPNAGGSVLTQVGGVNYPTYQDSAGNTPLPNPIPLNSRGEISNTSGISCQLFLAAGVTYVFTQYDAQGNQIGQASWMGSNAILSSDYTSGNLARSVPSIAQLRSIPHAIYTVVSVLGYYGPLDGVGVRWYEYDASDSTSSDNGGSVIVANDGGRWKLRLNGPVSIKDFGAYGDGIHSDDVAMANWLAALSPTLKGYAPAGTYNFTTAKTLPILNNISIAGDGARQTVFQYVGASTSIDFWTIGDGSTSMTGWSLTGFRFDSTTLMTGGRALHAQRMQNGNQIFDVDAGVFTQSIKHLWNGIHLDNVNVFKYTRFNIQVQNEGLMINGSPTSDEGSDVYLDQGTVTFCNIGYHVGGGQGGVYFGNVLAYGNGTNIQIDNTLAARKNREIFLSDLCILDGCVNYNLYIYDTLTSNSPIVINGPLASAGLIGSGGVGINLYVKSWPAGRINIGPGQLYNATSDGMRVDDASCVISVDSARHIAFNGGYGINATVVTSNIYNDSRYMVSNTAGNQSANVRNPSWTSFATTVTTSSGSIATLGSVNLFYQLSGGICSGTANIAITTNGTGAGSIQFTLPRAAAGYGTVYGKDLLTGKGLTGVVAANSTEQVTFDDGTYPGANNANLVISFSYQYL